MTKRQKPDWEYMSRSSATTHFPGSTQPVVEDSSIPFLQKVFELFAVLPAII